jgi:hypothetical protein
VKRIAFITLIIFIASLMTGVSRGQEPAELPERFTANLMVLNAPGGMGGMTPVSITIERWSTEEERKALLAALHDGGTDELVKAMEDLDVGYVQIRDSLGWRLRAASTWQTDKGRMVRVVTDRPLHVQENYRGTRSRDYPIGVIELILPPTGEGEGILLAATQVRFDDQGRIEVKSLPNNIGPQQLSMVQKEVMKQKRKKKKKAE